MYDKTKNKYVGWIYCIKNNINNKKYIGQTTQTIHKRFISHRSDARRGRDLALHNAMRKHGIDNFYVEELECLFGNSKEELANILDEREIYWIAYYDSYKNGYNETIGGQIGFAMSKDKLAPVDAYDLKGKLLKEFASMVDTEDETGVDKAAISRCCLGKSRTAKGLTFRFHGDSFDKFNVRDSRNYDIYQFNDRKELVAIYHSLNEAAYQDDFKPGSISAAIRLGREYKGFYWNDKNKFPKLREIVDFRVMIDKYSLLGDFMGTYSSMSDGARSIGKDSRFVSTISDCCYGKTQFALNYIWRIHGEPYDKYDTNIKLPNFYPINCYSLDDKYIDTFETLPMANIGLGINTTISNSCLKSKTHKSKGYKFYYIDDPEQPDKTKIKTINEFLYEKEQKRLESEGLI